MTIMSEWDEYAEESGTRQRCFRAPQQLWDWAGQHARDEWEMDRSLFLRVLMTVEMQTGLVHEYVKDNGLPECLGAGLVRSQARGRPLL